MRGERNFGLDCLRAVAISLVLASHLANGLEILGVCGVELFFVLSGFLIGGILLKTVERQQDFGFGDLRTFLSRRWFRTLPNYYLFLLIYLISFGLTMRRELIPTSGLVRAAFFGQNLAWPNPNSSLGHLWSLAVEEWFYLLSAGTLFVAMQLFRPLRRGKDWAIGVTILLFLLVPALVRFGLRQEFLDLRMVVIFRLDAIMYGVLMALLRQRFGQVWSRPAPALAVGSLVAIIGLILYDRSTTGTALALTLLPLGFSGLIPALSSVVRPAGAWTRWVEALSIWSYSIYLSHTFIYHGLKPFVGYDSLTWSGKFLYKAAAIALIIVISSLNYRFFEKPTTALRDRV